MIDIGLKQKQSLEAEILKNWGKAVVDYEFQTFGLFYFQLPLTCKSSVLAVNGEYQKHIFRFLHNLHEKGHNIDSAPAPSIFRVEKRLNMYFLKQQIIYYINYILEKHTILIIKLLIIWVTNPCKQVIKGFVFRISNLHLCMLSFVILILKLDKYTSKSVMQLISEAFNIDELIAVGD